MTTKAEPVSSGQSLNLHPLGDCVLVELKQSSNNFSVKEAKYDSRTEGIVIEIPDAPLSHSKEVKEFQETGELPKPKQGLGVILLSSLISKRVHFDQFNASDPIKRDGKQYGFIKISDIRGYEDA